MIDEYFPDVDAEYENRYDLGDNDPALDSPTDFDEHIMNEDDCYEDDDGQPDEGQEWHDFDPDC